MIGGNEQISHHEIDPTNPVFTLVFGHYHGPWVWTGVREELKRQGYDSIAPDLPIEDKDATLDDHAAIIRAAEEERGASEYINVGHSWGGDIIYRQLGSTPVSHLIFLAAPLRPVTAELPVPDTSPLRNSRTLLYHTWLQAEENGALEFDPELIGNAFYSGLDSQTLKSLAISQLRRHPHSPDEPAELPTHLPMDYVGFTKDRAFKTESQRETARLLDIDYTEIDTYHVGMLTDFKDITGRLIELVEARQEARRSFLNTEAAEVYV